MLSFLRNGQLGRNFCLKAAILGVTILKESFIHK
jgi:hypothetical protein